MSRVLFIADTHFGHANAIRWRPFSSGEEHDKFIFNSIYNFIQPRDILWILGDICLHQEAVHYITKIKEKLGNKGKLIICLGNHDSDKGSSRWKAGQAVRYIADEVHGIVSRYGFWLSHAPIHMSELRDTINIHGHVHSKTIPDKRYINVSAEAINYTPISLQQIKEKIKP